MCISTSTSLPCFVLNLVFKVDRNVVQRKVLSFSVLEYRSVLDMLFLILECFPVSLQTQHTHTRVRAHVQSYIHIRTDS